MHLLRGAGLSGLKGMAFRCILPEWDKQIPLIRPLLTEWREDIMTYCETRQLDPVMDLSNLDVTYFRNRLRHELIPYLSQYNPQFKSVIWRMAQNLESDHDMVQSLTQSAWNNVFLGAGGEVVSLKYSAISPLSLGLKRNLIRKAMMLLRPALRNIDFEAVERAVAFIESPPHSKRMDLIDGIWLYLRKDQLVLGSPSAAALLVDWPRMKVGNTFVCLVEGEFEIDEHWRLISRLIQPDDPMKMVTANPYQCNLDVDRITFPLMLRTKQNGDRIKPLGMQGHSIKLSDLFINLQVPLEARKNYPLICSGDEIVWVPGLRSSETSAVSEKTRNILQLEMIQISDPL